MLPGLPSSCYVAGVCCRLLCSYNKLVGAYMSDSEDEECEDEEDCDASTEASSSVVNMPGSVGGALTSGSVFQPAAGLPAAWAPAPAFGGPDMSRSVSSAALSSLSSSGTHQEGGGSSLGSPVALEPNNSTTREFLSTCHDDR
jgi:hypothetical protein